MNRFICIFITFLLLQASAQNGNIALLDSVKKVPPLIAIQNVTANEIRYAETDFPIPDSYSHLDTIPYAYTIPRGPINVYALLYNVKLKGDMSLFDAHLNYGFSISKSVFYNSLQFSSCEFRNKDIPPAVFPNYDKHDIFQSNSFCLRIQDCRTYGFMSLDNCNFYEDVDIHDSKFLSFVWFTNCYIANNIVFRNVKFYKGITFKHLRFSDSASIHFDSCYLPDYLDFSYNKNLPNEIDLVNTLFNDFNGQPKKYHYINFYQTDISKFHLDYFHFRLDLSNKGKPLTFDEATTIYEGL